MKKIIIVISAVIIAFIFYSLFNSENVNSLDLDFENLAFSRNENNTGPVQRVYVFAVEDSSWQVIKKHADLLPHTKYGKTIAYYFLSKSVNPKEVKIVGQEIPKDLRANCIAKATKDGMSRLNFSKYPYR